MLLLLLSGGEDGGSFVVQGLTGLDHFICEIRLHARFLLAYVLVRTPSA